MAPNSNTLAWKIPWTEEPGGLQSTGSLRVWHDWVTSLSLFTFMHGRRNWQLQCSCLENPRDGGAWWAAVYGVTQSQTQLKHLSSISRSSSSSSKFQEGNRTDRCGTRVAGMWKRSWWYRMMKWLYLNRWHSEFRGNQPWGDLQVRFQCRVYATKVSHWIYQAWPACKWFCLSKQFYTFKLITAACSFHLYKVC